MSATLRKSYGQIPRISGTIDRPRLLLKVQQAIHYRLTIITAPPGYGKTTLAAQFAHASRAPVAWQTIQERERDVPSLFAQAIAALRSVVPGIAQLRAGQGTGPAEYAALIANYLSENLDRDIVYILDDAHHLAGAPAAETWLSMLVKFLPPPCHLIVVSRIVPDLPLTEMISRRELQAIGQQDLRFRVEEIQKLAVEVMGIDQSSIDIPGLADRLEGWPAGTILALYPLPQELEREMLRGGQGPEALFDALAAGMLYAQSTALRDFLLASSTLERITPELCNLALGLNDSARWLEEAEGQNLFLTKITGGLTYHALFRSFLQRELQRSAPDRFIELHSRAAEWFAAQGDIDDAFEHYMDAGYYSKAARLAEQVAQSYFVQGKAEILLNWGAQFAEIDVEVPRLLYTCAMIHTDRFEYEAAVFELGAAEYSFRERGDLTGLRMVDIQRGMIDLQQGHYNQAAREARRLYDQPDLLPNLRARALTILGLSTYYLGDPGGAVSYLEEALPLYRADGDAYALSEALKDVEIVYLQLGRLDQAGVYLQEIVAICRALNRGSALALALNNLGHYYFLRSDYRQAQQTLQEGLAVATRVLDRRAESYLVWTLGDLYRDIGSFNDASRLYKRGLELVDTGQPVVRANLLISESVLHRWQGHYAEAIACAEAACDLTNAHQIAMERALAQGMAWAARAYTGDAGLADNYLKNAEQTLNAQNAPLERLRLLAARAETSLLSGDMASALERLETAEAVAHSTGTLQPFTAEVFHSTLLQPFVMTRVKKKSAFPAELRALQHSVLRPKDNSGAIQISGQNTYSLRIQAFGQEEIYRDGTLVLSSAWRATGAREMFLYLLFVGPQTREDFSLIFWPDSSASRVRSIFHTTLYRARKALGDNVIIFEDGLYRVNPALDLRSDATSMKSWAEQARHMPPRDARTEDLWGRAVDLYRGEFLPSVGMEWVASLREEFHEMHLDSLIGLGECVRARHDQTEAITIFKRASHLDPFREDIHRLIMTCYGELGQRRKVKTHLDELRDFLWQELAVQPSSETLELARSLLT